MARTKNPEVWSFFSGALGLDLGLEMAGIFPTLVNEIDPDCCETIRKNRPHIQLINDSIATLDVDKLRRARGFSGEVDLMVGGPPCQSFSPGGKRAALTDPRGNLIYEYLRLVGEVRPRYFVLENVANLTTAALRHRPISERPGKHWSLKTYDKLWRDGDGEHAALSDDELSGSAIRQILADVRGLGYFVTFGVLDAADYGAAQHRLRFVMVGARDFPPPVLPSPTHGPSALQPYQVVRDAIWKYRRRPGPGARYTPDVEQYFTLVPEGGNWRSLPVKIQRKAMGGSYNSGGGKTGFYRRLSWDRPSPTITGRANRKGSALCHPDDARPLSVRECAAIQGFMPDWKFSGSMSSQYMQIGNAVPVALGRAIAEAIKHHKEKAAIVWSDDYDAQLERAVTRLRASARNKRGATTALSADAG
jgi:DNA (cytosine-5)-methyltransferase 1